MRRSILLLLLAVGACASPPAPTPAPPPPATPVVVPPPAAPPSADWRDWPQTPGQWTWRRDARGSVAMFGVAGGAAAAILRCDRARQTLFLSVPGSAATNLTVRTSSTARTLAAQPTGDPAAAYVAVAFNPNDRLLDAMGFSRGRFTIERAGEPTGTALVLPAWAEVERVTQDCRGG